jgi:hypothetical protein
MQPAVKMVRHALPPASHAALRIGLIFERARAGEDAAMALNKNKLDPRLQAIDRTVWSDRDPVIQILDADGTVTIVTRKQADLPAPHIRRWLRLNHTAGGAPIRMKILAAFRSSDGVMFFPETVDEGQAKAAA